MEAAAFDLGSVRETVDFFHREFTVLEAPHDGTPTGGTEVESKKFVICVHVAQLSGFQSYLFKIVF